MTIRLVPQLAVSRFRGKSDYYSPFLAVDDVLQIGPIVGPRLKQAVRVLAHLGEEVTTKLSKAGKSVRVSRPAATYAVAVEKAASDKDRREARHRVLVGLLKPFVRRDRRAQQTAASNATR